jgi:hypothetical protein
MNVAVRDITLPNLIDRASKALLGAKSSAEILEARDIANIAYHAAKATARIAKARNAHDNVVAAAHRAQADALEIEALAKRRLADEYDAAQDRGEIASVGDGRRSSKAEDLKPTASDIGLTHKDIHEARKIRDAEERQPGIIRGALDAMLKSGKPPSRTGLRRAVLEEDDDSEEEAVPTRKKDAFLIFANEALLLAKYDGPIDLEIIEAAKDTASAWGRLVSTMEQGK